MQYFKMFNNRCIYYKGLSAIKNMTTWLFTRFTLPAFDDDIWELYDSNKDWIQTNDLSSEMADTLHKLQWQR